MLKNQLRSRLERSNQLYCDLVDHIPESLLASKLQDLPSNTIGAQIWCVVGARDSYLRAAKAGSWQGFKCPLAGDKVTDAMAVRQALSSTAEQISFYLTEPAELTEPAAKFLLDLLEHEAQHHGQLARYLYGLKAGVPQSWKDRYNFD
jgi:hypothetical protein